MLSSYLAMTNAIMSHNAATANLMQSSNNMLSAIAFGNSLPLKPSFSASDNLELQNKTNETKISILQKIIDAIKAKLGKDIEKSTPKYSGVNYKA